MFYLDFCFVCMTLIATVDYEKNIFGFSIYDSEMNRFIVSKDTFDNRECDILKSILYKLNVDLLLLTLKIDNDKYNNISEINIRSMIIDRKTFRRIKVRPFDQKEFEISSSCFNALITYLQREDLEFINISIKNIRTENRCPHNDSSITQLGYIEDYSIFLFEHNKYLYMGHESLKALGIFRERINPNLLIKSKCKDTSLFKIINHTNTVFGCEMLKKWLCFPFLDVSQIEKRREMIEFILKNNLSKKIIPFLKRCKDIENIEKKFTDKKIHEYFSILNMFARNALEVFILYKSEIDTVPLNEISRICMEKIELTENGMFIIKKGVSEEIDQQKQLYNELPTYLNEVAKRVANQYKTNLTIVYFPQLGYLIETEKCIDELLPIITSQNKFYYKNEFMNVLDEELGDVLNKIIDLEKEEVILIKGEIDRYKSNLLQFKESLAKIDCLNSLAIAAKIYDMRRPRFNESPGNINVKQFRNIFIDTRDHHEFDININGNTILTGENGSGKSTFLKAIGNIIVLNQIGSFLPCKTAEISIFDKLFTKFYSVESIKNKRSAFMSDVLQVNQAIYYGTSSSIFLVDEFGKGTDIIDGASLLFSLINNIDRFLCIYVTHFQEFIECNLLINVKHYNFDKFQLKEGMHIDEYGIDIFKRLNFDDEFIAKFKIMKNRIRNNEIMNEERNESWAIKIINDFLINNN